MGKKTQIDILADFIMGHVEGEPSENEGAGDTAVRIIKQLQAELEHYKERLQRESDALESRQVKYHDVNLLLGYCKQLQAELATVNRDLDLHDIIVSTYKVENTQLQAENERLKEVIDNLVRLAKDTTATASCFWQVQDGEQTLKDK